VKRALRTPRGRKRKYGPECIEPLCRVWVVMDLACGRRMAAGMADTVEAMVRFGELGYPTDVIEKLCN
jgi:hypothetical protein